MQLSIVIPCLNEEETIWFVVSKWIQTLKDISIKGEILVVDNNCIDQTALLAEQAWARVVTCIPRGNGNALRKWFEEAYGEYIIMLDADDSYNIQEIKPFLQQLDSGADLVIGSRLKWNMETWSNPRLHRYIWTPIQTWIANIMFWTNISDIHSGMRWFRKSILNKLELDSEWFELCTEMIIKAWVTWIKITEIPINFYKDKRSRKPHLKTRIHGRAVLKYMLLYSPKQVFVRPGYVCTALGVMLMFLQIWWPSSFFGLKMDIHLMILGLTLGIVGPTLIAFGLLTAKYAKLTNDTRQMLPIWTQKVSIEKWALIGWSLFLIWFVIDATIVYQKIFTFESRNEIITIRRAILGWYFIATGILIFFFSFAWVMSMREKSKMM